MDPRLARSGSIAPSRRAFLQGAAAAAGVFCLGSYVPFPHRALAADALAQGPIDPNLFLKVAADNSVTVISKHFEMGQGVTTGLATLVAEEFGCHWSAVRVEFAPNDARIYNNLLLGPYMGTGGSNAMAAAWEQMRKVGAAARMMFVAAAAAKWQVPPGEIAVEKGEVVHALSGRRATFGELAAEAMRQPVPSDVPLKPPRAWTLIGTRLPRVDSAEKARGTASFASDVRRPGMLTAMVRRPDLFGARVAAFDAAAAKEIDGVVDVVQVPSGIAVLATDTWAAMRGRDAVKVTWDLREAETRSTADIVQEYRALANGGGLSAARRGDAGGALLGAARMIEGEFVFPYLAHAPMEPLNGVIEARPDGAEIWSGCQLQSIDEVVVARVLGLKPEEVRINTLLAGGSFGRRGDPTGAFAAELAAVARAIDGRAPVHLVWTREDDIKGGFYRPMVLHRVKAGLDPEGRIAGWLHRIVSQSLFIGTPLEAMRVNDGIDSTSVQGVVDTPYAIPDFSVETVNARSPVPVLWWRSVGHSHTAHVMETTIDELAHAATRDPVEFRLSLLAGEPRAAAVLRLATEKAGWNQTLPQGRGRGVAYHRAFNTRVAMVAEVTVDAPSFTVDRVVAAVDCGVAINPDNIVAQIEGSVGFALSAVLRNQVTLNHGVVEQSNFDDYEPTRIREMPKVEVHIVESTEAPSGIGEPGLPPLAPAIGNAIFAATGKRLRLLPFELPTA